MPRNQHCPEISSFYTKITKIKNYYQGHITHPRCRLLLQSPNQSKYLQQLHCALRLLFSYLEDFPLGIEAIMAAEGKPTPSRADFPSSIRMCHSFSAAWHHSEMDALGREREQTLIPAPNTFGRCMGCCLNNLISTSPHQLTHGSDTWRGQTGWERGPLSIPSCTHPFMPQGQKFIIGVGRERRCPSGKSYPA